MNSYLFFGLVVSCAAVYGKLNFASPSRDIDFTSLVRESRTGRLSIVAYNRKALADQTPYAEAPLSTVKYADMSLVDAKARSCFHLRYMVLDEGLTGSIDIGHAHLDHSFAGGKASITSSTAATNSSMIGWRKAEIKEVGVSAGFKLPSIFGESASPFTVSGKYTWINMENGATTKSSVETKVTNFQADCPPDAICDIVTWTYLRVLAGRCGAVPLVDTRCYGETMFDAPNAWPNTSVVAYASLENEEGDLFPWALPIAGQYWWLPEEPLPAPHKLPEKDGLAWHATTSNLTNQFEGPCSFSYPLTQKGKLLSTQARLVFKHNASEKARVEKRSGMDQHPGVDGLYLFEVHILRDDLSEWLGNGP
ncbi:hypothetical protein XA68_18219 [Ophiocordyceps unilateralis]|uniref:Uncharacterized protein n=1 Tax=Ophiocordyceps unilateralis TaxID=268505 RepID=A0A2A9PRK8_OPHUN|nr:hypothetical protein XA68_18219 [Ophiocordyceps unilateralis]